MMKLSKILLKLHIMWQNIKVVLKLTIKKNNMTYEELCKDID